MASDGISILNLPFANPLAGLEVSPIVQDGETRRTSELAALVSGGPYLPLAGGIMAGALEFFTLNFPGGGLLADSGNLYYVSGTPLADNLGQLYEPGGGLFVDAIENTYYPYSSGAQLWVDFNGSVYYPFGPTLWFDVLTTELKYPTGNKMADGFGAMFYDDGSQWTAFDAGLSRWFLDMQGGLNDSSGSRGSLGQVLTAQGDGTALWV